MSTFVVKVLLGVVGGSARAVEQAGLAFAVVATAVVAAAAAAVLLALLLAVAVVLLAVTVVPLLMPVVISNGSRGGIYLSASGVVR